MEGPAGQLLSKSWFDSAWIPALNQHNVMEYFSQRSNPFYDRTCNNEVIRMQRADPEQLVHMTGTEYMLLHVQDPILYVIRKAHRQSPDKVTPLADYYILNGIVYQCPDIQSVVNSRLLSALHLVNSAFSEALSYSKYDPSKGYYWQFPEDKKTEEEGATVAKRHHPHAEEPSDTQRRRVDVLLNDLMKKFQPKAFTGKDGGKPQIVGEKTTKAPLEGGGVAMAAKRPGQPITDGKLPEAKRKRT